MGVVGVVVFYARQSLSPRVQTATRTGARPNTIHVRDLGRCVYAQRPLRVPLRLRSDFSPAEAVADATDGLDQLGGAGVFLDFFAEPAYMDINSACIANVVVTPDVM